MIYLTTTYHKIKAMTTRIKVVQGGQGAGKNYAIGIILFERMISDPPFIATVMTDTYDNLKDGAIQDFENIFNAAGYDLKDYYNKSTKDIHFLGSVIQFRYISDNKKQAGKSKRRDILYINETNKIGWGVASTYIGRTSGDIYLDLNPDREDWVHTEVPKMKDLQGNQLSSQIIVTYQDNELIPEAEKQFILGRKDNVEWFRVYGLGLTGVYSERRIYNYQFYDTLPDKAIRISSGMDFGVSPDPTCLVDLWLDDNKLYADEVFEANNLMPEKIQGAERMSIVDKMEEVEFPRGQSIVADSAGAISIRDLKRHGYNITGVKKFTGSVLTGINQLRGYDLFISHRSLNLKKGIERYFWKVDQNDKIIPEPDGHEPDTLAAIRYSIMKPKKNKFTFLD